MSPLDFGGDEYKGSGEYEVIPKDSIVPLIIHLERNKENPDDNSNLFYHSTQPNSNVLYMKWKFTVLAGSHKDVWFRNNQTVSGGSLNGQGQSKGAVITGRIARQIIESSRGIRADDNSPEAVTARVLQDDWNDLDGMVFLGKVGIEGASAGYGAKNKLVAGIPPDHREHYEWRAGGAQAAPVAPAVAPVAPAVAPVAPAVAPVAPAVAPAAAPELAGGLVPPVAPAVAPAAAVGLTGGFVPPPISSGPATDATSKPDWAS